MLRFFLITTLILSALASHAQNPSTGGPAPSAPNPTNVPLDGGASLLLAGGVAYGLRHLRQRRKSQH